MRSIVLKLTMNDVDQRRNSSHQITNDGR